MQRVIPLPWQKLELRAKEASAREQIAYSDRLKPWYWNPEQLVFCDETSKDGRSVARRYGRSKIGQACIATETFSRGKRLSVLAALDITGFIGWGHTDNTFDRELFHKTFCDNILPLLNPWPLPRSIVVMDNARIHLYRELESAINAAGAHLIFLPPYSPHLNPIETAFSLLKAWLTRHAPRVYGLWPRETIEAALVCCTSVKNVGRPSFAHSGYGCSSFALPKSGQASVLDEEGLVIVFSDEESDNFSSSDDE